MTGASRDTALACDMRLAAAGHVLEQALEFIEKRLPRWFGR